MTELNLSRRSFLSKSAAAAALTVAVPAMATEVKIPSKWDETYDVVVVGSGFAGLCAAYAAARKGCKVVVLEKMRTFGGNSIINGGELSATGAPQQVAKGIKDSKELWIEDTLKAGASMNYPEKVQTLADKMLDNYFWLRDEIGVKFSPTALTQDGGHSVPRSVITENGSGSGYINPLLDQCKKLGVKCLTRQYVEHVIRDAKTGRVMGVQIRSGYRFPKKDSGKVKTICARKAVIMCHGGFSADVKYRMMLDPKLSEKFDITNQPGATGELWREACRIGCNVIQASWIQVVPFCSPYEKGMGVLWTFSHSSAAVYGIWVDSKTGKRFVNELANRKVRSDAMIPLLNSGSKCLAITDVRGAQHLENNRPGSIKGMLESGGLVKFNSLKEIAEKYNIPFDALAKEVEEYNANVRNKVAVDKWGRGMQKDASEMKNGPWYAAELMPKIHHCMGGIATNSRCQALDVETDEPIPGLFAAGEASGGVHGAVRLGCNAILDCTINGRIAGESAADSKAWC